MSKAELLQTIDLQKRKIETYEKKLKDVIRACKALHKEKATLQASLLAVSSSPVPVPPADGQSDSQSQLDDDAQSVDSSVSSVARSVSATTATDDDASRVASLQAALKSIAREKAAKEAAFTEDRKNLLKERDKFKDELESLQNESSRAKSTLEEQVKELKTSLRHAQSERDGEQNDNAAIIRELQLKLTEYRKNCDQKDKKVKSLESQLSRAQAAPAGVESRARELQSQLDGARAELSEARELMKELSVVPQLKKDLTSLKLTNDELREKLLDSKQSAQSEMQVATASKELRVNELESRLASMAAAIGEREAQHQQDTALIDDLKARITKLEQESNRLASLQSGESCFSDPKDVAAMADQPLLRMFNAYSDELASRGIKVDLYEALKLQSPSSPEVHESCKQRYDDLRREFDKFRIRAQAAVKKRPHDDSPISQEELVQLQKTVTNLHQKLHTLEEEQARSLAEHRTNEEQLRKSLVQQREANERSLAAADSAARQKIMNLESEMSKQRARTAEIIAEKERELEEAKLIVKCHQRNKGVFISDRSSVDRGGKSEDYPVSPAAESGDGNLGGNFSSVNGDLPLYYAEQLTRRDQELRTLSAHKKELEATLRELQHASVSKDLQHGEVVTSLRESVRSLESRIGRAGSTNESMEYLKNVILRYMMANDYATKQHILKAIGKVLYFSPDEMAQIKSQNDAYWFKRR